jgi:hypothetical protein
MTVYCFERTPEGPLLQFSAVVALNRAGITVQEGSRIMREVDLAGSSHLSVSGAVLSPEDLAEQRAMLEAAGVRVTVVRTS